MSKSRTCAGHTCGGQVAHAPSRRRAVCVGRLVTRDAASCAADARKAVHPVFFFAASRTHAVDFGCAPAHGSCFPGQGKSPGASPTHRNARKAELCSLAFRAFPMPAGDLRPERPRKPASSQKKGGDQRKGAGVPLCTETLEKAELCSLAFSSVSLTCRRFAARRAAKPASSAEEKKIGRRAQEWGSKGRSPFANLCLLSFRKKVEARRGLSDKRKEV